jgi:hypothetical protein
MKPASCDPSGAAGWAFSPAECNAIHHRAQYEGVRSGLNADGCGRYPFHPDLKAFTLRTAILSLASPVGGIRFVVHFTSLFERGASDK